jgi:hypothetical protein
MTVPDTIPPPRTRPHLHLVDPDDRHDPAPTETQPVADPGECGDLDATITAVRARLADLEARARYLRAVAALTATDPQDLGEDVPVLDGLQVQGDAAVFPWPSFMSPHVRHLHATAAVRLPAAGLVLLGSHRLRSGLGPACRWADWPEDGAASLGTLVVPAGAVCRMVHEPAGPAHKHGELRIGPGVYAVRRQRRYVPDGGGRVTD